jgi:hypothetical protein
MVESRASDTRSSFSYTSVALGVSAVGCQRQDVHEIKCIARSDATACAVLLKRHPKQVPHQHLDSQHPCELSALLSALSHRPDEFAGCCSGSEMRRIPPSRRDVGHGPANVGLVRAPCGGAVSQVTVAVEYIAPRIWKKCLVRRRC